MINYQWDDGKVEGKIIKKITLTIDETHSHWIRDGRWIICNQCRTRFAPLFPDMYRICSGCGSVMDEEGNEYPECWEA